MRRLTTILTTASIMIVLILIVMNLSGNQQGGAAYPDRKLTIYNQTGQRSHLQKAVDKWNQSGINLKIQLIKNKSSADVVASSVKRFDRVGCAGPQVLGCASVGSKPWPFKGSLELKQVPRIAKDNPVFTDIAAHEIGHLLGLRHSQSPCALMNNDSRCRSIKQDFRMEPTCPAIAGLLSSVRWCPGKRVEQVMCGPSREEVERLVKIYGGKASPEYDPWCKIKTEKRWEGWCVYPSWVPSGESRPEFIEGRGEKAHCTPDTPPRYWAALLEAIEELKQIEAGSVLEPQSDAQLKSVYEAWRDNRISSNRSASRQEMRRLYGYLEKLQVKQP